MQELPHPQLLQPQDGLGQQRLHLHLGGQGLGGHLRSQDGLQQELHPHEPHPADRSAEAPRLKAAAAKPNAIGLKNSLVIYILL